MLILYFFCVIPPVTKTYYTNPDQTLDSEISAFMSKYESEIAEQYVTCSPSGVAIFLDFKKEIGFKERKKIIEEITKNLSEVMESKKNLKETLPAIAEKTYDTDDYYARLKENAFVKEYFVVRRITLFGITSIVTKTSDPGRMPKIRRIFCPTLLLIPNNIVSTVTVKRPPKDTFSEGWGNKIKTWDAVAFCSTPYEIMSIFPVRTILSETIEIIIRIGIETRNAEVGKWFPFP